MDDLISRQAVMDAIEAEKLKRGDYLASSFVGFETAEDVVRGLPSAQPDHSGDVNGKVETDKRAVESVQNVPNDDLISKKEAIDAMRETFKRNPTTAIRAMETIRALPSAQPEIIRCKDCGYYDPADNDEESDWCHVWGETTEENAFCSYAEGKGEKDERSSCIGKRKP